MLRTNEWDLHELLRELFERQLERTQEDYENLAEFAELVREEDEVALWFGDEHGRGRGARFEARTRYDADAGALVLEMTADDEPGVELFRIDLAEADMTATRFVTQLGSMHKPGLHKLYAHLESTGGLDRFFYEARKAIIGDRA